MFLDCFYKDKCDVTPYHWAGTACGRYSGADMTCDQEVDWNDLQEIADWWLARK